MNKKNLMMNCVICDLRNLTEAALAPYAHVTMNCAVALVTPAAQALLEQHGAVLNIPEVLNVSVDEKWETQIQNGKLILAGQRPRKPTILVVNGLLLITPEAGEALTGYPVLVVNGLLLCPKSLSGRLPQSTVNGSTKFYPDEATVLSGRLIQLDRIFSLRARAREYFLPGMLAAVDPQANLKGLLARGVRFLTESVVTAEGLLEDILPLIPEDAAVTVVPDGTRCLDQDNVELDLPAVRQYGKRLYVRGDVTIRDAAALEAIEYLAVDEYLAMGGDLTIPEALVETAVAKGFICKTLRTLERVQAEEARWRKKPEPEDRTMINATVYRF